jgi:hypothetical protein
MDTIEPRLAARRLFARAERLAARAFSDALGTSVPLQKGYELGGDDVRRHVHRSRMLGALKMYEASLKASQDGFTWWTYALQLETICDFKAAAEAYQRAADSEYAVEQAQEAKTRCLAKLAGSYSAANEMNQAFDQLLDGMKEAGAPLATRLLTKWMTRDVRKSAESVTEQASAFVQRDHQSYPAGNSLGSPAELMRFAREDKATSFAEAFVGLLVHHDFDRAYLQLHPHAQSVHSRQSLREYYVALEESIGGTPEFVGAIGGVLSTWPAMESGDIASVYVSIEREGGEAVSVVVTESGSKLAIRSIEWGRP